MNLNFSRAAAYASIEILFNILKKAEFQLGLKFNLLSCHLGYSIAFLFFNYYYLEDIFFLLY